MPSPMPKRKQAVKAKLMYATGPGANCPTLFLNPTGDSSNAVATWLIPALRYEEAVQQMAKRRYKRECESFGADPWEHLMHSVRMAGFKGIADDLAAIGIKPLTPTKAQNA